MAKILSLQDDVSFDVPAGETLLEAALRPDVPMAHACGGRAKCSTCRVWVLDDPGGFKPQKVVWHGEAQPWDFLDPDVPTG